MRTRIKTELRCRLRLIRFIHQFDPLVSRLPLEAHAAINAAIEAFLEYQIDTEELGQRIHGIVAEASFRSQTNQTEEARCPY